MAEAPITGLTSSVKIGPHATATLIGYMSGVTLNLDRDIIEIMAFGLSSKEKVPSIKDWTLSVDGTAAFVATESQAQLYDAYDAGTLLIFDVYLTPTMYFEGSGYIKSMKIDVAADDKVSISMEVAGSGGVVFSLASGTAMLTFACTDHATAGATQIASVSPALTGGNSYMYKVNGALPAVGKDLTGLGWATYTLTDPLPVINGNYITLAEVSTGDIVVRRGLALSVVA